MLHTYNTKDRRDFWRPSTAIPKVEGNFWRPSAAISKVHASDTVFSKRKNSGRGGERGAGPRWVWLQEQRYPH